MNLIQKICVLTLAVLGVTHLVFAGKIHLKSGVDIEGEIIEQTEEYTTIDFKGIQLKFYKEEIVPPSVSSIDNEVDTIDPIYQPSSGDTIADLSVGMDDLEIAYMSYAEALNSGDWDNIKQYLSVKNIQEAEQMGDINQVLIMMKMMKPQQVQVIGKEIQGEEATLELTGKGLGGESKGTVNLIREGNQWKIVKENWEVGTVQPSNPIDIFSNIFPGNLLDNSESPNEAPDFDESLNNNMLIQPEEK